MVWFRFIFDLLSHDKNQNFQKENVDLYKTLNEVSTTNLYNLILIQNQIIFRNIYHPPVVKFYSQTSWVIYILFLKMYRRKNIIKQGYSTASDKK